MRTKRVCLSTALLVLAACCCLAPRASPAVLKPPVTWIPSPNFDQDRNCSRPTCFLPFTIDSIVIHTTEETLERTLEIFTNESSSASAHYVVARNGTIIQMVEDECRAWTTTYTNGRQIGIENVGWAGEEDSWTFPQLGSLTTLVAWLVQEYDIPLRHPNTTSWDYPSKSEYGYYNETGIYGHFQVQTCGSPATQPKTNSGGGYSCKTDPGPFFPWDSFLSQISFLLDDRPILEVKEFPQRYDCQYVTKGSDSLFAIQQAYKIPYWQSICLYNTETLFDICTPDCLIEGKCEEIRGGIKLLIPDVRRSDFPDCEPPDVSSWSSHDILDGNYSSHDDRNTIRNIFLAVFIVGLIGIVAVIILFVWRQIRIRRRDKTSFDPSEQPESLDFDLELEEVSFDSPPPLSKSS